jgi:hypothetical protein
MTRHKSQLAASRCDPSVYAAALPAGMVVAYDRVEPSAANVARVFTRTFGSIARRRAAR